MIDDHHIDPQAPDSEEEFARLRKLLRSLPEVPAPENFEQELQRRIQEVKEARTPWWKGLFSGERIFFRIPPIAYGAAATVAVVFIGYYIITSRNVLEPPPAPSPPPTEQTIPSPVESPSEEGRENREGKSSPTLLPEKNVTSGYEKKPEKENNLRMERGIAPAAEPLTPERLLEKTTEEPAYLFRSRGAYDIEMEDSLAQIDSLVSPDSLQNTRVPRQIKSKKKLPPDK